MAKSILRLGFDPGRSATKVIYQIDQCPVQLMLMEPEVIALPTDLVQEDETNRFNSATLLPEKRAWVQLRGDANCHLVGWLAREYQAFPRFDQLKYEEAVVKFLAVVGVITQRESLPDKFAVEAAVLLPYNEFKNHHRLKDQIERTLKNYQFRGQRLKASLDRFFCSPEGGGLAWELINAQGEEWFYQKTVCVLMLGHGNMSCLTFRHGNIDPSHSQTNRLGFVHLLDRVAIRSAGLDRDAIAETIFAIGGEADANHPLVRTLVRATHDENIEPEVLELCQAIQLARTEYWTLTKNWIDSILPSSLDALVIGGGNAQYLKAELSTYLSWADPMWSQPARTLHRCDSLMGDRLSDIWHLFTSCLMDTDMALAVV